MVASIYAHLFDEPQSEPEPEPGPVLAEGAEMEVDAVNAAPVEGTAAPPPTVQVNGDAS